MKILAIAGSNSRQSINKTLVSYAAGLSRAEATIIDMSAYDNTPIYSSERQQRDGFPAEITALFELIQAQDGILLASPEHNGSMPAVLKNVIDWLSRINMKFLGNKPTILMSTSPGPNGGQTNLATMSTLASWWGAKLIDSYSLGRFYEQMQAGELQGSERERLLTSIAQFDAALQEQPLLQAA